MRMSEAMRLGALRAKQGFGALTSRHRRWSLLGVRFGPFVETSCALGAAFSAGNCPTISRVNDNNTAPFRGVSVPVGELAQVVDTPADWTRVLHSNAICPLCGLPGPVFRVVPHMNDDHKLPRGVIADFVEAVENDRMVSSAALPATTDDH